LSGYSIPCANWKAAPCLPFTNDHSSDSGTSTTRSIEETRCAKMAKTKASPPKKAKKATTAKEAVTVLRRSPRKAVQSAKIVAAEENVATEATKRNPKKPTKAVFNTSTKGATKSATAPKATKSPSPKKTGSPSPEMDLAPSLKRGRPKKATKSVPPKSKATAPSESRISSRTRSQTPPEQPGVPVPDIGNDWTDSPKKRSLAKTSTKKAVVKTASKRKPVSQKVTKAVPGSVRKSIELPEANLRDRSSSPGRRTSLSPARGRSRITRNSKTCINSVVFNTGWKRAQSRILAGKTSNTAATALALSRASVSLKKDELTSSNKVGSSRSCSPAKAKVDSAESRASSRSCSPVKIDTSSSKGREPSRSRSPAKPKQRSNSDVLSTTVRSVRGRSKTLNKAGSHQAKRRSSGNGVISTLVLSPRLRGRPRDSSTSRPLGPLQINKTRNSRSHAKASTDGTRKLSSTSPQKPKNAAAVVGRRSNPSPVQERRRSTSLSETQAQLDDEYDMAMQDIEDMAYSGDLDGAGNAYSSLIGPNDRLEAMKKGVERAELQKRLRAKVGLSNLRRPQSAKLDQYRETPYDFDDTSDELSSLEDSTIRQKGPRRNASTVKVGSPKRSHGSPEKRCSSAESQSALKRSPSKNRPSCSSRTSEYNGPLQAGQPSGKGRGTVHSVTNKPLIPGTNRKNPFFETMPGPEVWHRRMPPFPPFGETPLMEREMRRQISEDLAKGE
jgi:hypothetical protein